MNRIPDLLLCVGAQKSGTTWLYNRMAEHEDTRTSLFKEMHYFTTVHNRNLQGPALKAEAMRQMIEKEPRRVAEYFRALATGETPENDEHRLFRPMNDEWYVGMFRGNGRYTLDFTPAYAKLGDEAHAHIQRISERQKVIFVMREPLDRALSAVRYLFKGRGQNIATATEAEIMDVARNPQIVKLSNYKKTIDTLERNYAAENLRFLFYETMMNEKARTLDAICDWLEISRLSLPSEKLEARDNSTAAADIPAAVVDYLAEATTPFRASVEARLPEAREAWAKFASA
ncbi:MAG: sulfotransferase [Roseovarius sp.]